MVTARGGERGDSHCAGSMNTSKRASPHKQSIGQKTKGSRQLTNRICFNEAHVEK